jgi:hypothetical protein
MTHATNPELPELRPPPRLDQLSDALRQSEPQIWQWFSSEAGRRSLREAEHLYLLQAASEIIEQTHPELYRWARQAAATLNPDISIALYRYRHAGPVAVTAMADAERINVILPQQAEDTRPAEQWLATFGQALGPVGLWMPGTPERQVAKDAFAAVEGAEAASPVLRQSARRFRQYLEIFSDRTACVAAGARDAVVLTLARKVTGEVDVRVSDLLRQARERTRPGRSENSTVQTHQDLFLRLRALDLWWSQEPNLEDEIARLIEGQLSFDYMELSRQEEARRITRDLLDAVLEPHWMRREATLSHARRYFDNYQPGHVDRQRLAASLDGADDDFRDYAGYVMLDFVTADRQCREAALAHTLELSEAIGIKTAYLEMTRRELRLRKTQLQEIGQRAAELLAEAAARETVREQPGKTADGDVGGRS